MILDCTKYHHHVMTLHVSVPHSLLVCASSSFCSQLFDSLINVAVGRLVFELLLLHNFLCNLADKQRQIKSCSEEVKMQKQFYFFLAMSKVCWPFFHLQLILNCSMKYREGYRHICRHTWWALFGPATSTSHRQVKQVDATGPWIQMLHVHQRMLRYSQFFVIVFLS